MHYVELLRARRVLMWYGAVLLGIIILATLGIHGHSDHIRVSGGTADFEPLLGAGAIGALIVGTFLAAGLNHEFATLPIVWTRPTSRDAIAWRYVAIDIATIVLAQALMIATIVVVIAIAGGLGMLRFDPVSALPTLALGLGAAVMWYALVVAAAARIPGRGGTIAGLSWPVFSGLGGLAVVPFPQPIHALFAALVYLSPMAWLGNIGSSGQHPIIMLPMETRAACEFGIAALALIAGVRLWSTKEA